MHLHFLRGYAPITFRMKSLPYHLPRPSSTVAHSLVLFWLLVNELSGPKYDVKRKISKPMYSGYSM